MSAAEAMIAAPRPQPERLTWDEIRARYPDEWVVLIYLDIVEDQAEPIRSAVVFDHGPGHGVAFRRCRSRLPEREWYIHRYTGDSPGPLPPWLHRP